MQSLINSFISLGRVNTDIQTRYTLDNDILISMMDQLHKINMDSQFSLEIPCPHIVVVGDQGLGKSTTLDRLLGAEILPMRQSTHESSICTLFPTIYHTLFTNENKDYIIELWYKKEGFDEQLYNTTNVINFEEIKNIVKTKYAEFYVKNKDNKIERVKVIVKGAKLTNKYVVDLPGIRNDKSEQSAIISRQIINYLDNNPGAIILFFLLASGPERTSAWSIINKYIDTHIIIPVLIRPDELGMNDKSIINILTGKTDIKLPNENVYVIKNPNTLNNEIFDVTRADIDEMLWFKKHPIYGHITDSSICKKFGFVELANKIIHILNSKYCEIVPKIIETAEYKLHNYKQQRNQLGNKLVINESNKLFVYKSYIDEFLKKIRGIMNGEITAKISGLNIKSKIKDFCNEANNINYIGKFDLNEINLIMSQCGGSRDLYTRFSEEILINMIFKDDKSSGKQLELLIKQYIECIVKLFREIILEMDFSNTQLDQEFWNNLKEKLINNIDKKYLIDGFNMLCTAQEVYFGFESLNMNTDNRKVNESLIFTTSDKNNDNTSTKYVLTLMEEIWNKYVSIVKLQFGKYIQKHLIEYNLSDVKIDNIFYNQINMEQIIKFLKEPDGIEKRREELDKNIERLETLLNIINKIRIS